MWTRNALGVMANRAQRVPPAIDGTGLCPERSAKRRHGAEAEREARLIVCAVDGSIADTNAVEVATQLAVLAKARLALVAHAGRNE